MSRQGKKRLRVVRHPRVDPSRAIKLDKAHDVTAIWDFFGEVVGTRRLDLDMSRWELANLCGKTYGFIQRIETGKRVTLPRPNEFIRLCKALRFSTGEMLELAGYTEFRKADSRHVMAEMLTR